ncbi:DUF4142 domain-containing protein [Chelativorans sp. YIM 93263]|uniref:DUF4142 domain-containing protein n=1 Tax=Chelativorans sp. YIM 93263 TaxID=2906648 RepID=UPI0023789839|nr:DUF4142 domain-containing protein [Chelativorans sp. YIM 93263]
MYRTMLAAGTALALLFAFPAMAQDDGQEPSADETTTADSDDIDTPAVTASTPEEFVTMAAHSNMFEIESSRIALERAQDPDIRDFAQQMIDDHTTASEELTQAAEADGITDIPQTLDERHQQLMERLQDASADIFDNRYLQMQITAHEEAIALFESFATEEGALGDFAEATLPTLQEHLDMVSDLAL